MKNIKNAGLWVGYGESKRIVKVKIMCIVDNYAMVRRKGASPVAVPVKELEELQDEKITISNE